MRDDWVKGELMFLDTIMNRKRRLEKMLADVEKSYSEYCTRMATFFDRDFESMTTDEIIAFFEDPDHELIDLYFGRDEGLWYVDAQTYGSNPPKFPSLREAMIDALGRIKADFENEAMEEDSVTP